MSEKVVDAVLDFANALEAASVKLRMHVGQDEQKWSWNPEAIKWEKASGARGEYERSSDVNSADFRNLEFFSYCYPLREANNLFNFLKT